MTGLRAPACRWACIHRAVSPLTSPGKLPIPPLGLTGKTEKNSFLAGCSTAYGDGMLLVPPKEGFYFGATRAKLRKESNRS